LKVHDQDSMIRWLSNAKKGEKVIYYDGMLMADKERFYINGGTTDKLPEPMRAARVAWSAYMNDQVHLIQKRKGFLSYDYIAVRA
jgi:hypothetical protein